VFLYLLFHYCVCVHSAWKGRLQINLTHSLTHSLIWCLSVKKLVSLSVPSLRYSMISSMQTLAWSDGPWAYWRHQPGRGEGAGALDTLPSTSKLFIFFSSLQICTNSGIRLHLVTYQVKKPA